MIALREGEVTFAGFGFQSGEAADVRLRYATAGTPGGAPVLMLHWTGGSMSSLLTPEFVEALHAPGRPLGVDRHFLVFVDNVGHGASSKPSDGLRARFPRYRYRDMIELQRRVVRQVLGIDRLRAVVGISMGAMHAWMWAETWPAEVETIVPIVAMPLRISGRNLVWRRIVSRQIRGDPEWRGGEYEKPPRGFVEAYPILRMMLHGVPQLQEMAPDVASADAFVAAAAREAETMDANDLLYALEASDDYDPVPERIATKVLAVNFADDEFNPLLLVKSLIYRVPNGRLVVLPGGSGHLTHGKPALWADRLRELADGE